VLLPPCFLLDLDLGHSCVLHAPTHLAPGISQWGLRGARPPPTATAAVANASECRPRAPCLPHPASASPAGLLPGAMLAIISRCKRARE
jgi:hypothetical protein